MYSHKKINDLIGINKNSILVATKCRTMEIPNQKRLKDSVQNVPVEFFRWGVYPDHFKIEMPHRHDFAELLFISKGGGVHEIDFIEHQIQECSIHFIPKSTIHFLKRSKLSEGFTIAFDADYLEQNKIHRMVSPFLLEPFILNLTEKSFREIIQITDIIQEQIKINSEYFRAKCFLLSLELLLNRLASEKKYEGHTIQEDPLVRRFKVLLKANIHRHQSVAWYANELHISPKSLSNHVKNKTKLSAKSLIINELLVSVKKALINSNHSIKEIALTHEMNTSSLGKLFKKQVGCTMVAYRSRKK